MLLDPLALQKTPKKEQPERSAIAGSIFLESRKGAARKKKKIKREHEN